MINKIVRKTLLKTKLLLFAVFVLFLLAISMLSVSQITYDGLETGYDNFKIAQNTEDYRMYVMPLLIDKTTTSWEKNFEEKFDSEIEAKEYFSITQDEVTYEVNKYNSDFITNKIKIEEGSLPENSDEIVIQPEVLERKGYKIGDTLKISDKEYTISGTAYMPEYSFPRNALGNGISVGDDKFIPVYMNQNSFNKADQDKINYYTGVFNQEYTQNEKQDLYKQMKDEYIYQVPYLDSKGNFQISNTGEVLQKDVKLLPIILGEQLTPSGSLNQEINGEKIMLSNLSAVIMIIALLVTIVLFNSIFNSQKREMGILKAEGISTNKLSGVFILALAFILIISSILGFLLGLIFRSVILDFLHGLYSFPPLAIGNEYIIRGIGVILFVDLVVIVLVYFLSIKKNLKTKPLILIKNIVKEKTPRFRFKFITEHISFINKYKFNILVRNISISILLAFGVFVSSFLLLMGGSMYSNLYNLTNNTYQDTFTYDYEALYSVGVEDEVFDENSIIKNTVDLNSVSSDVELNDLNSNITLYGYDFGDNELIKLSSNDELDDNKTYISEVTAKKYELEIGDTLKVVNPYKNDEIIDIKVEGIIDDQINNRIYMNITKLQKVLSLDSTYANGEIGTGNKKDELKDYDKGIVYSETVDLEDTFKSLTSMMMVIIGIIAIISFIISFITMSIITVTVIKKNRKTLSVMKVLGYTDKEIKKMVTAPYKWVLILVYILSIPIFKQIIQFIIDQALKGLDVSIEIKISWMAIGLGFIVIALIYICSMSIATRSIKHIKLSESLKADE